MTQLMRAQTHERLIDQSRGDGLVRSVRAVAKHDAEFRHPPCVSNQIHSEELLIILRDWDMVALFSKLRPGNDLLCM